ncbi:MAG: hypothetical protein K6L74_17105 [Neptuniibacter sp.]
MRYRTLETWGVLHQTWEYVFLSNSSTEILAEKRSFNVVEAMEKDKKGAERALLHQTRETMGLAGDNSSSRSEIIIS